jgi:hypothetical protein
MMVQDVLFLKIHIITNSKQILLQKNVLEVIMYQ